MAENGVISKVIHDVENHWYSISTEGGMGFALADTYGVEPKMGDNVTLHTVNGCTIRGIDLNGVPVFYKSTEQLEQERKEWCDNY